MAPRIVPFLLLFAFAANAGPKPATRVWIDIRAFDAYRCVTSWEEVCASDLLASHRIELAGDRGRYQCAFGLDEAIALDGANPATTKVQGYAMSIQPIGDQLEVKGPNMCFTGEPWEKSVAQNNVQTETYRFVPLAEYEAMRSRALRIVPNHRCPNRLVAAEPDPKKPCIFVATRPALAKPTH